MSLNFYHNLQESLSLHQKESFFIYYGDLMTPLSGEAFQKSIDAAVALLISHGVHSQDQVLLMLHDPIAWLTVFFASVKIGAVPALFNFQDKFHRKNVLAMNEAKYLCTDLSPENISEKEIIPYQDLSFSDSHENIKPERKTKEDLFFAIYTSGTSGKPKYVEKTYQNILTELYFLKNHLSLQKENKFFTLVPQYHIYGLLFGVLLPVTIGAQIIFTKKLFPREVIQNCLQNKISVLVAAPIHYQAFLETSFEQENWGEISLAISSGAPLSESVARGFVQKSSVSIAEFYGSTETGGIAYKTWNGKKEKSYFTFFPYIERPESFSEEPILWIDSPSISENLIRNQEDKWFNTGDAIKLSPENKNLFSIEGRQQQILKVGGKRISTVQLENELKSIEEVNDVVVLRKQSNSLRQEVGVAFIHLCLGVNISSKEIRKRLQGISTNAGVLKKIILVESIQRNKSGKVIYDQFKSYL